MLLRVGFMWVWSAIAMSASRVIITTPEPMQIFVNGMMIPMSTGTIRTSIPHMDPGEHAIALHSLTGTLIYTERINVPDGADVRVLYTPGAAFSITGATSSASAPAVDQASAQVAGAAGIVGPGQGAVAQGAVATRRPNPSTADVIEGAAVRTTRASGLKSIMASPTPTNILTNSARGLHSMTAGAKAGVSFGAAPVATQTIKRANVVFGQAVFNKAGGGPLVIYEDGHMIASLGPGASQTRIKLEVGRRVLEIRSGVDYQVLFRGDLQVDANHIEQLNLSESVRPTATIRPWLWSDY